MAKTVGKRDAVINLWGLLAHKKMALLLKSF
ncbi:MAG: hypothetical protein RLZZ158_110 [Cyanobacteriota bacterium]|jgi:hypothetical protein